MATLTIKNIPDYLYQALEDQAAHNHRSINSEVIVSLEKMVAVSYPEKEVFLNRARQVREKTTKYRLTDKKLRLAKNKGRP